MLENANRNREMEKPLERQTLIGRTAADGTGSWPHTTFTDSQGQDGHEGCVGKNEVGWDARDDSLEETRQSRLMF